MVTWIVAGAAIALGVVGIVLSHLKFRKVVDADIEDSRRWWFEHRRKERDDLREAAKSVGFRPPDPGESAWDHAEAFNRWSSLRWPSLTPPRYHRTSWASPVEWEQRMPSKMSFQGIGSTMTSALRAANDAVRDALKTVGVTRPTYPPGKSEESWTFTMQTYWWSIELDGVVHKGAMLRHDNLETWILWCDIDYRVERSQIREHLEGKGPLVTCVWCSSNVRRD